MWISGTTGGWGGEVVVLNINFFSKKIALIRPPIPPTPPHKPLTPAPVDRSAKSNV